MRLHRLRPCLLHRLVALLFIAAGLLLHPTAESMGALHETLVHATPDAHAHDRGQPERVEASTDAAGAPVERPDALHALLHLVHCCSTAGALPALAMSIPKPPAASGKLVTPDAQAIGQRWLRGPFRPPIAA